MRLNSIYAFFGEETLNFSSFFSFLFSFLINYWRKNSVKKLAILTVSIWNDIYNTRKLKKERLYASWTWTFLAPLPCNMYTGILGTVVRFLVGWLIDWFRLWKFFFWKNEFKKIFWVALDRVREFFERN